MGLCCEKQEEPDDDYVTTPNVEEDKFKYHSATYSPKNNGRKSKVNQYRLRPGVQCFNGLTVKELMYKNTGDPRLDKIIPTLTVEQVMEIWTIRELTPYLYLCAGCAIQSNHKKIVAMGITCIVNISSELNTYIQNIDYVQIPVNDKPSTNLLCFFRCVANLIQANAEAGGKTIVHCVVGVSRSASLCIAYFITYLNQTFYEALDWVRSQRFIINPNKGFRKQLKKYEDILNSHLPSPKGNTREEQKAIEEIKRLIWKYRTRRCKRVDGTFAYQSITVEE